MMEQTQDEVGADMFKLEQDMIPHIRANLATLLNLSKTYALAHELPVGDRVADIAVAEIDEELFSQFSSTISSLRRLSMPQLYVLAIIARGERTSIQSIRKQTYLPINELHTGYIKPFLDMGLVDHVSRYSYRCTDWRKVIPPCLITVEAKLARWNQALMQGIYNIGFSDYSYVVLDDDCVPQDEGFLSQYGAANVGLFALQSNGEVRLLLMPRLRRRTSNELQFQKIRVLKDLENKGRSKWKLVHGGE